jgi:hypothetical protein
MKWSRVCTVFSLLGLLPAASFGAEKPDDGNDLKPFAVVELFTSEGCSSCPAAERLLGKLVAESRQSGETVYPLAFHVDYWDRLGWKDRFSDPAYSERQYQYSQALGLDSAYTPQMIVNGTQEFVGSDEARVRRSISEALKRPVILTINLAVGPAVAGVLPVDVTLPGTARVLLRLALVERKLRTQVSGGENSGRQLSHENVVRAFESLTPGPAGKVHAEITLPKSLVLSNASLVAYAQDPESLEVLAATSVDLP